MKTVMKKMFSLLLVAVLLVGIMPFQAFAAEDDPYIAVYAPGASEPTYVSFSAGTYSAEGILREAYSGNVESYTLYQGSHDGNNTNITGESDISVVNNTFYILYYTPATTPTCENCGEEHRTENCDKTYCSNCNGYFKPAHSHCDVCHLLESECDVTCPGNANYVAPKATVTIYAMDSNGEKYTTGKTFEVEAGTKSAKEICDAANYTEKTIRSYSVTDENGGNKCTREETITLTAGAKYLLWLETAPISGSTPNPGTGDNNDTNTGDDNTTDDNNDPEPVCTKCNGAHDASNCPNNGDYDLKIYATMWTGDGREETVYLGTFYNLTTNTKIPEYMKENSSRIDTWVAAVCSGYTWNDRKIYENKWSTDQMEWNDRMGYTDQEAYINVFRPSKDVVIFLHTGRTYVDYDWIKVEGKTTNDTLTLDEAKAIVKKYYNFTDLKMYDNDDWNEYVDGNDNIKPWNAVPISDYNVTKIHVLMSGYSAKNYSGSNSGHTADSTNPKTGDMIYAPAIVLGASVSTLAVLFYLNKKRAH